jgi:hypothetical protein
VNKVLFSSLPLILVLLTGCEHLPVNNSNTIPSSESVPTNFSAVKSETPEGSLIEKAPSLSVQDIKKFAGSWGANTEDVLSDNFFLDPNQTQAPNISLGEAMDFDNFFSNTVQTKSSATAFTSVTTKSPSLDSAPSVKPLEASFGELGSWGDPIDFDNFLSDMVQTKSSATAFTSVTTKSSLGNTSLIESIDFDNFFSNTDFQFDAGKQRKIKIIKEATITTQKNNVIADQIRNEDVDTQLITDLANLEKNIPIKEKELAQMMNGELKHKIRLLDAETALKVAEVRMKANSRSNRIISRIEDRVLSVTSLTGKELIKKMLISEPDNYYQLKDKARKAQAEYQVTIARVKLQYQKKIDVVENDIKSLRIANKKIIDIRLAELEGQRIAEAMIVGKKIKAKNQIFVDGLYPELKPKILEYIDTIKKKISIKERQVLERLESTYIKEKLARDVSRESKKRQYIADINQQIKQEQQAYEDKSRDRLSSARNSKFDSIIKSHKRSLIKVESDGVKDLATLKAQHAREHEKQKNTLQAPYKKKEQILNQKSQQSRSKVLSRFNSENYALIAKERKETDVINREINAHVKVEIKIVLDSFEALKKEEEANAKKISAEKPKESPGFLGFFESLF